MGEGKGLDGGGGGDGVLFDQVFTGGGLEGGEGNKEERALGDEDDAIVWVGGEIGCDGCDEEFVELLEISVVCDRWGLWCCWADGFDDDTSADAEGFAGGLDKFGEVDVFETGAFEGDRSIRFDYPCVKEFVIDGIFDEGCILSFGGAADFFEVWGLGYFLGFGDRFIC